MATGGARDDRRDERGQAVLIVAVMMIVLFAMAALAFDTGVAQADRRNLQAMSDDAVLAGVREYLLGRDNNAAHWVALQYLGRAIGFSVPTGTCGSSSACAAGAYTVGSYTMTLTDSSATVLDLSISHTQVSIFGRAINAPTFTTGGSARATPPGPVQVSATYAVAAVSGNVQVNGGGTPSPSGDVGGPVYAFGSYGSNNGPHAPLTPSVQHNYDGTVCPGNPASHLDNGGGGNGLSFTWTGGIGPVNPGVAPPHMFDSSAPTVQPGAPVYTTTAAAQSGGSWQPGIYNGVFPSGGTMAPGVYKLLNVTSTISLGSITNKIYTPSGTEDTLGAVAIALDSTDTGSLDLSQARLNGLGDLHLQSYVPPPGQIRDPQGTHNFVLWGGNGASGYRGGMTIGPGAGTDMSGIIYLPQTAYTSNGNSSPHWTGSLIVASLTINGGGNGEQIFNWVCGLNSSTGQAYQGGLVR